MASVNELAIPVGRPVNLKLTSGTVMQSFHVPKLAGQIYAMAGMTTELSLRADNAGTFRGRNTQYNGEGFAQQHFAVVAMPSQQFDAWISRTHADGAQLDRTQFLTLAQPGVPDAPIYFGQVQPSLFDQILMLSTTEREPLGASPRHQGGKAVK